MDALLPPLSRIAAALRAVTETLALELAVPTDGPPPWSDFEWRIGQAVTAMHGVSALLRARLRWRGPARWRQFLEEQQDHVAGRQHNIAVLLEALESQTRAQGIPLVPLKGAALHTRGLYRAGERPMADIDLLVREADVAAVIRLLETHGFEGTFTSWRDRLFEPRTSKKSSPFGEHVDNPIKIELHTRIRERLPVNETDITAFLFPRQAQPGLNGYSSDAALMLHLLLHAAGNMRVHALRLIQLHDIARLAARFDPRDWEELLAYHPDGEPLWWAAPPLRLAAHYHPDIIPQPVIARLNRECPWLLGKVARRQRLSDVSWSNVRAYALPGIEWSRSCGEALGFVAGRIFPGREARLELKRFAEYHPGAAAIPWYGISQGARILRWVVSRPPRVQTLLCVRAALASDHRYRPL
jgi:Uncharacterised nucleotidyltransferase